VDALFWLFFLGRVFWVVFWWQALICGLCMSGFGVVRRESSGKGLNRVGKVWIVAVE